MPRKDVEFKSNDGVTLRGWLYTPASSSVAKLPCIILINGFAALKNFGLDDVCERFVANLPIAALVYDHRSWGSSDTAPGQLRQEIIPSFQMSDLQDAITYVQTLDEIDENKVGIWGSSFAGGLVLQVAATDKRVKAVISQVPVTDAASAFQRLMKPSDHATFSMLFQGDRIGRAAGQPPARLSVASKNPAIPACLTMDEAVDYYTGHAAKVPDLWTNDVTFRSVEYGRAYNGSHLIDRISPMPLLLVVAKHDYGGPTDLALSAYNRALEPKKLTLLDCTHFQIYSGEHFEKSMESQVAFLKESLCGWIVPKKTSLCNTCEEANARLPASHSFLLFVLLSTDDWVMLIRRPRV